MPATGTPRRAGRRDDVGHHGDGQVERHALGRARSLEMPCTSVGISGDVTARVDQARPAPHQHAGSDQDQRVGHRHVVEAVDAGRLEVEPEHLACSPWRHGRSLAAPCDKAADPRLGRPTGSRGPRTAERSYAPGVTAVHRRGRRNRDRGSPRLTGPDLLGSDPLDDAHLRTSLPATTPIPAPASRATSPRSGCPAPAPRWPAPFLSPPQRPGLVCRRPVRLCRRSPLRPGLAGLGRPGRLGRARRGICATCPPPLPVTRTTGAAASHALRPRPARPGRGRDASSAAAAACTCTPRSRPTGRAGPVVVGTRRPGDRWPARLPPAGLAAAASMLTGLVVHLPSTVWDRCTDRGPSPTRHATVRTTRGDTHARLG